MHNTTCQHFEIVKPWKIAQQNDPLREPTLFLCLCVDVW